MTIQQNQDPTLYSFPNKQDPRPAAKIPLSSYKYNKLKVFHQTEYVCALVLTITLEILAFIDNLAKRRLKVFHQTEFPNGQN